MAAVPRLFANVTAMLEDIHSIAVEGQCRDNCLDMQRVLISQMQMGIAAVDGAVGEIKNRLGDGHD